MAERRTSSRASGGAKKAGASRAKSSTSSAKGTAAAKKGGAARGRQQKAQKTARTTSRAATKPAKAAGVEAKTVAEFRQALRKNVMLTRERIEEALEKSGKLSPKDARGIASDLLKRGRKETDDVLKDLENLLEKGRRDVGKRSARARRQAKGARSRAVHAASPALAQADRARRAAKVGSNFPITLYEELNVAEIKRRLPDLTPAELRKVRDYERRNANRKGVLSAIESKLP